MARASKDTAEKVIGDRQFEALIKFRNSTKSEIAELSGAMGDKEKSAAENANLHSGAFKAVAKLVKMDELKREAYIRNFAVYVDKARRLKLFGEEHAGDLAEMAEDEGQGEESEASEGEPVKLADAARTAFGAGFKKLEPKKGRKSKNGEGGGMDGADAPGGTRIQ